MKSPTPCLMTGPYDFSEAHLPRSVFEARIGRVREKMRTRGVGRLAVHGNAFDHAALAWLTNFTPKLGPAFALIEAEGPLKMLFSGGPGMKPSALALTFVEDMTPARGGSDVGAWLAEGVARGLKPGLVEGEAMMQETWRGVSSPLGDEKLVLLDGDFETLRRKRAPEERKVLASAFDFLDSTFRMAPIFARDMKRRALMVALEAAGYAYGAQDVRVLLSRRDFGPAEPLTDGKERLAAPAQLAIALRHRGHWVTGRAMIGPVPKAALKTARETIETAAGALRPGRVAEFSSIAKSARVEIHGVGLSVEEAPRAGETIVEIGRAHV